MMKNKFYAYVDKYLMAMGINVNEYSDLDDSTVRWLAFDAADICRTGFDMAYDIEEVFREEKDYSVEMQIPDAGHNDLYEEVMAICRNRDKWKGQEEYAATMCRSILAKILFSCDGNTLVKANLDIYEKEFLIAYDFRRFCFRESVGREH